MVSIPLSAGEPALIIEAETAADVGAPMRTFTDTAASGGRALIIPDGVGKTKGHATLKFNIERSGRYVIWARVLWPDYCGNSFFFSVDGGNDAIFGQDGTYKSWHWRRGPEATLRAGEHSLRISNREDGAAIDTIAVSRDANFVPTTALNGDAQEIVFGDDFSRTQDDIGLWRTISGEWGIRRTFDPNGVPEQFTYEAVPGVAGLVVAGAASWSDYRAGVSLKPGADGTAGLVICYGEDRYLLWRVVFANRAEAQLCAVHGDETAVLFSVPVACPPGQWYRLEAEVRGQSVRVFLDGEEMHRLDTQEPWAGGIGLAAESDARIYFDDVDAHSVADLPQADPTRLARTIFANSFERDTSPRIIVFDDFTAEERVEMERERPDYYRPIEQYRPVLGARRDVDPLLVTLPGGSCNVVDGELVLHGPARAGAWINVDSTSDVRLDLAAKIDAPETAMCATLAAERDRPDSGYTLRLKGAAADLLRAGTVCARTKFDPLKPGEFVPISLDKRGPVITGSAGGKTLMVFTDPEPLGGTDAAFWCEGGDAAVDEVTLSENYHDGVWRVYPFEQTEPMWWLEPGLWTLHGGMACISGSNWISSLKWTADAIPHYSDHSMSVPDSNASAVMWCKERFPGDVRMQLDAAEFSKWHGWTYNPTSHTHFSYHNIGITIGADGASLKSGYTFIIGGWKNTQTILARNGRIVARSDRGVTGRSTDIIVERKGGALSLIIDDAPAISWHDPEPLAGDRIAIWNWSCPVNYREVRIRSDREPIPTSRAAPEKLDYDVKALVDLLNLQLAQ